MHQTVIYLVKYCHLLLEKCTTHDELKACLEFNNKCQFM